MYQVKIIVSAQSKSDQTAKYGKKYIEGIFIPKRNECPVPKIKTQVEDYIRPKLEKDNPDLILEMKITTSKLADDFVICEDKE